MTEPAEHSGRRTPEEAREWVSSEAGQEKIKEAIEDVREGTSELSAARRLNLARLQEHITL